MRIQSVGNLDQLLQVSHLRDPQLLGTLRSHLSRVAVDRLAAGEHQIVASDGLDRLGQNVAGRQRITGRGPPVGQQNRSIDAPVQTLAQHVGRLGRSHRQEP